MLTYPYKMHANLERHHSICLKSINFLLGIQSGNYVELFNISSSPGEEHSFLLDSFAQFESLARKALHSGE